MNTGETVRKLSEMTDDAAFERLAVAVLREAKPEYAALLHTGINTDGKTVKSPVDGIAFVAGAQPPHMIAAHHTTCARADLKNKWLHDPATVKPRKGGKPTAPAGDVLKTAELVVAEKKRTPFLRATLVLTTNKEPPEDAVRDTIAAGSERGIDIDIWSVTLIAHFLDNTDQGQWLRREHLGIEQERLSRDLLAKLSGESLKAHAPYDKPDAWVSRSLDRSIAASSDSGVVFIIAESGLGKSVACYKYLTQHVAAGGYGIIVPHDIIASAQTLDQAVDASLRQLHPQLAPGTGLAAQKFCSNDHPLLLIVEDINKSGQASPLAEKLAKWGGSKSGDALVARSWRLLCPIWPQVVASLGDEARKRVQALAIMGEPLSPSEGREAVQRRSRLRGKALSDLDADAISDALAHDPLLIALHEPTKIPQPASVIEEYIDKSVARLAATRGDYTAADYRTALRAMASAMLMRRELSPLWTAVLAWLSGQSEIVTMLRHLTHQGEVVRLSGDSSDARLVFRHGRVRDALFSDTVAEMIKNETLGDDLLAEPYFAEVIGAAIIRNGVPASFVERVRADNPLALFHALRIFREPTNEVHNAVLASINAWLADPATQTLKFSNLRWDALAALSETESSKVIEIVTKFRARSWTASQALFRNGNLSGGLQLCLDVEPGVGAHWRDRQIEHAKMRFGANLRTAIDKLLRQVDSEPSARIGALRLAGYLADPQLAEGIETSWNADPEKIRHLQDYLWATAQCCGNNPERFLGPICDAWAALSDKPKSENSTSPRYDLAADNIRWAFHKDVPVSAIPYFVKRGQSEDLRWSITIMLNGLDHPDAVEFVVRELVNIERRLEGKNGFSPFTNMAPDEWRRRQEDKGRPMSRESRERLLAFWQNQDAEKHLREQSFRLWAASVMEGDLELLRSVGPSDLLADKSSWERLKRKDRTATDRLLIKLQGDRRAAWWRLAHFVWSEPLYLALDQELERRRTSVGSGWNVASETDYAVFEIIMALPLTEAEPLLVKHWDHLQFSSLFVQTALFLVSPRLQAMAKAAIDASPEPAKMFTHLTIHYGIRTQGRAGVTQPEQIEALIPYLDYLDEMAIHTFWTVCTDLGWLDLRRKYLDNRLSARFEGIYLSEDRAMESLDKHADRQHSWIDRWIEDYLEAGFTIDEAMGLFARWLSSRRTMAAFRLTSTVVVHAGRRQDLSILDVDIEPEDLASELRANTRFAVCRRTLH
jgi:hypothetical protein